MQLHQNYVRNCHQILDMARNYDGQFQRRVGKATHGSFLPFYSQFSTLFVDKVCSNSDIDIIFADCDFDRDLRDLFQFIQIQRYSPGDYIVPHQDVYSVTKLHLVTLTSGPHDALICQSGDKLIRVADQAGQKIDFPYNAWHWVDPCVDVRYSLVIGE